MKTEQQLGAHKTQARLHKHQEVEIHTYNQVPHAWVQPNEDINISETQ